MTHNNQLEQPVKLIHDVRKRREERGLDVLVIMCGFVDTGKFRRQLILSNSGPHCPSVANLVRSFYHVMSVNVWLVPEEVVLYLHCASHMNAAIVNDRRRKPCMLAVDVMVMVVGMFA